MIELFDDDKKELNRQSSKGNQLKWEKDEVWYKADYTGYEGLSEYVVSHLLRKSSLRTSEFVVYDLMKVKYRLSEYNAAASADFTGEKWQIITLERLFKSSYGTSLNAAIYNLSDHMERLKALVSQVERATGLAGFGAYMQKILAIDAFFLNEDRHTHNLAVLTDNRGNYRLCPIFDNGAALLSDTTMDYPLGADTFDLMKIAKPKTFCESFDEQLEIATKLYGDNISFAFTEKDVDSILAGAGIYENAIIERVRTIIFEQMRRYKYLFS